MRELGYLPGEPSEWDGELLLDYMRGVSWWMHAEEPLRLAPEDLWRGSEVLRDEERNYIAQLKQMTLPPEALLLRRWKGSSSRPQRSCAPARHGAACCAS